MVVCNIFHAENLEKQTIGINHEYFIWVDHTSVHKIAAKEPLTMNAQNPAASSGKRSTLVSRVSCGTESDWLLTLATSYAVHFRYIPPYTTACDVRIVYTNTAPFSKCRRGWLVHDVNKVEVLLYCRNGFETALEISSRQGQITGLSGAGEIEREFR